MVKIKHRSSRNEIDNFEGPNLRYYTSGISIRQKNDYIGDKAKEKYYNNTEDMIRRGACPYCPKDTLFINGHLFEGVCEYIDFKTGTIIYKWGLSKTDLLNIFEVQ